MIKKDGTARREPDAMKNFLTLFVFFHQGFFDCAEDLPEDQTQKSGTFIWRRSRHATNICDQKVRFFLQFILEMKENRRFSCPLLPINDDCSAFCMSDRSGNVLDKFLAPKEHFGVFDWSTFYVRGI